jgi:hypothetical protein
MNAMENAFALVVGIADYERLAPLPAAVRQDARDLCDTLADPTLGGYSPERVRLLLDGEATGDALRRELEALAGRGDARLAVGADATVFIYISCRGARVETGPRAGVYLLLADADLRDEETLARTSLSGEGFAAAFAAIPARKVVAVFDCGHASEHEGPAFAAGLPESFYESLKTSVGRVVIASARADESPFVAPGARNSLFAEHLLAGLCGGANAAGGVVRVFDLFEYVGRRVAAERPDQHPLFRASLEENIPVALHPGRPDADPETPPTDDGFAYDVFISYRHREPDKSWVRKKLAPALRDAGLKVFIDYLCFDPGSFVVKEMERAIEQSRYTVTVLSPNYLESGFTDFEQTLAQHMEIEKRRKRYIGVLLAPCEPSLSVRARFWLEMTDEEEFRLNLPRLTQQLRERP